MHKVGVAQQLYKPPIMVGAWSTSLHMVMALGTVCLTVTGEVAGRYRSQNHSSIRVRRDL